MTAADGTVRVAGGRARAALGLAGWTGAGVLAALVVAAVSAPWLAPFEAAARPGPPYAPPGGAHLLGTDDVGRDVFSLLLHGARSSLAVAAGVAVLSTVLGFVAGGVAGIARGLVDTAVMRLVDVVLALPFLPLLVVAAAFVGRGLLTQVVLISLLTWARPARIVRAGVLAALGRGHVESAAAMGARRGYLLRRHVSFTVAPLVVPLVVRAAMGAVLLEASLAFLGLGDPQRASWGTMLYWANVRAAVLTDAWLWWVVPPGAAIASMVVALGLIGMAWEERLNPDLAPATLPRLRRRATVPGHSGSVVAASAHPAAPATAPPAKDAATAAPRRDDDRALLTVERLHVTYRTADGSVPALRGVDLRLLPGSRVGLVGESGSGKTTLARTLAGLLPANAVADGRLIHRGRDLLLPRADWSAVRGSGIGYVPQGGMSALTPVLRVGEQVAETLRTHRGLSGSAAQDAAREWLERVGLSAAHARAYPHELSGGMRQRAVIAAVLAAEPEVVVADEPTTGLDVLVGAQVLDLLAGLQAELGTALLLVSHDLRAVQRHCDELVVCYAGQVVERGPLSSVRDQPRHPYTAGLLAAVPHPDRTWAAVPGSSPEPARLPSGCAFRQRCAHAWDRCAQEAPQLVEDDGVSAACHLLTERGEMPTNGPGPTGEVVPVRRGDGQRSVRAPVLEVRGLSKTYRRRSLGARTSRTDALRTVDLQVGRGDIVGLVGRSGSGKSTLLRCVLGLEQPDSGRVLVDGRDGTGLTGADLRNLRRTIGYVAQDAYASLHPAMPVRRLVAEPLRTAGHPPDARLDELVARALRNAGLDPTPALLSRTPGGLSGGQRQRVALARGIVGAPVLLLADEPTSMLDVSIRAGVAATLRRLADELGLAVLVVTHDLAEAAHLCDRLVVLDAGAVAETGPADRVARQPAAPITRTLMAAAAMVEPASATSALTPR